MKEKRVNYGRELEPRKTRFEFELRRLLHEAAKAHHEFEAARGRPDDDWPTWYARYIAERLPKANCEFVPHTEGASVEVSNGIAS